MVANQAVHRRSVVACTHACISMVWTARKNVSTKPEIGIKHLTPLLLSMLHCWCATPSPSAFNLCRRGSHPCAGVPHAARCVHSRSNEEVDEKGSRSACSYKCVCIWHAYRFVTQLSQVMLLFVLCPGADPCLWGNLFLCLIASECRVANGYCSCYV